MILAMYSMLAVCFFPLSYFPHSPNGTIGAAFMSAPNILVKCRISGIPVALLFKAQKTLVLSHLSTFLITAIILKPCLPPHACTRHAASKPFGRIFFVHLVHPPPANFVVFLARPAGSPSVKWLEFSSLCYYSKPPI
jgi:hypothetical protein